MIVEVHGLELFGRHGVNDDERRNGQTFLFDVTLEIAEPE
jgi:dihydroneopterin aldolase